MPYNRFNEWYDAAGQRPRRGVKGTRGTSGTSKRMNATKQATRRGRDTLIAVARSNRRLGQLPMGLQIAFADEMYVKLRYVEVISMNAGAGGTTSHTFSANGMFDPNITGVGHQPIGFDQYMKAYQHYSVVKSNITVKPVNNAAAAVVPGACGCYLSATGTYSHPTSDGGAAAIESQVDAARWMVCGHNNTDSDRNMRVYFSKEKIYGSRAKSYEDTLAGSDSSNPSEQSFYVMWQAALGGNDPILSLFYVTIDYWARLYEKAKLPTS